MEYIQYVMLAYTALLPMVNPFSTVSLFLSLTGQMSEQERRRQGNRAVFFATCIMLTALFLGSAILSFFNISIPALRIAGGLIVAYLGFCMLFPDTETKHEEHESSRPSPRRDFSMIPLALPSLSGAGTIAMMITFSSSIASQHTLQDKLSGYLIASSATLLVGLTSLIVLRASTRIIQILGEAGIDVMSRVMGLLMVCIGIQFIANGVTEFVRMI